MFSNLLLLVDTLNLNLHEAKMHSCILIGVNVSNERKHRKLHWRLFHEGDDMAAGAVVMVVDDDGHESRSIRSFLYKTKRNLTPHYGNNGNDFDFDYYIISSNKHRWHTHTHLLRMQCGKRFQTQC